MSREHVTEEVILERLGTFDPPDAWARPMDLGGSDQSNHSAILARLVKRGLVERVSRSGRCAYVYRLVRQVERNSSEG